MKFRLLHILLLLLITSTLRAQSDSTLSQVLQKLIVDLSVLPAPQQLNNQLVERTNAASANLSFTEHYKALHSSIFENPLAEAETNYQFLNDLDAKEKHNLIFQYYFLEHYFQDQLAAASLPAEISFLVPALSGMNMKSVGSEKRAGLWQLTHFQAVLNGLSAGRLVDERFEPGRATEAAIAELVKMKKLFGTDEKAVLAYLAGPVNLRNALAEMGDESDVEKMIALLPSSVAEYLALWQAMTVFLTQNKPVEIPQLLAVDTIQINRQVHFQQLVNVLNVPLSSLKSLNPHYPYSIIPGEKNADYVFLPRGKKEAFQRLQDSVYALYDSTYFEVVAQKIEYPPAPTRQYAGERVKDLEIEGKTKIKYTLKSGDVLGYIAEDYNVRVEDLKYWNNISNERRIQAGQKLDIFVDDEDAEYYRQLHPEPLTNSGTKNPAAAASYPIPEHARKIEHVVKSGESPYVIAQQYKGVTPEAILYWNGISDARKIQIGQKLTIYVSE